MEERVKVIVTKKSRYNDYNVGEIGYVDGYVRGGDNRAYAVVIINEKLIMVDLRDINVLNY